MSLRLRFCGTKGPELIGCAMVIRTWDSFIKGLVNDAITMLSLELEMQMGYDSVMVI